MGIMNYSRDEPNKMAFWMSSSDYLNDLTERVHSVKVLAKVIDQLDIDGKDEILAYVNTIAKADDFKITRYFNQYAMPTHYNLVLSFSRERDSLPIWGRYAEESNGIAIGIDEYAIKNQIDEYINLVDIDYSNGERLLSCWHNLLEQQIEEWRERAKEDTGNRISSLCLLLNTFCNIFKSQYFEYEKEVRLYTFERKFDNSKILYRISNGLITPYRNIVLDKSIIREILIGPSNNPLYSKKAVEDYCFTVGLKGGSSMIRNSTIPLRR